MVAADYTVSPTLIFQDNNMGAIGGAVGGVFGMLECNVGRALSAYKKTPEGKVVVASMTDPFNNLVQAVKNYQAQEATGPHGMGTGGKLKVN